MEKNKALGRRFLEDDEDDESDDEEEASDKGNGPARRGTGRIV